MRTFNELTKEWQGQGEVVPRCNEVGNWIDEQGRVCPAPLRRSTDPKTEAPLPKPEPSLLSKHAPLSDLGLPGPSAPPPVTPYPKKEKP